MRHRLHVLQHPRLQPFQDQSCKCPVGDAFVQHPDQPVVIHVVKETRDVRVYHPPEWSELQPEREFPDGISRAAFRPVGKAVPVELRFVDGLKDHLRRVLHDLVLQHGYPQWSAFAVFLGNIVPSDQPCPVRLALQSRRQGPQVLVEIALVVRPRHLIDARSRLAVQAVEARSQGFLVQETVQPPETVLLVDPRTVRYAGKDGLHMLLGLSIPHVSVPPALTQRRSLPHPRWSRGLCARLSRAPSTTYRSDSRIGVRSAPVRRLRVPSRDRRGPPTFHTYLLPHAMLSDSGGRPSCPGLC